MSKGKDRGNFRRVKGMIRPWYRSRLFWLGVPALVFLLWGWVESMRQEVSVTRLAHEGEIVLASIGGLVKAEIYTSLDQGVSGKPPKIVTVRKSLSGYVRSSWNRGNGGDEDVVIYEEPKSGAMFELTHPIQWFQPPLKFGKDRTDWSISPWSIRLAYWFLVLAYLAIWLSMVALWQRRKYLRSSSQ